MLLFLTIISLFILVILLLIVHDIIRITKDLNYINQNDTNGEVTTSTSFPIIKRLAWACNFNLNKMHLLKERQETQNKQFNRMLTNLTHDIKTPLTVSMGYVQLLNQTSTGKQRQDLQRVQNNLDSVNYYLHYLMDFNLIQEKDKNLNLKKFNLSDVLQEELFNYYDQLTNKKIHVKMSIDPKVFVISDEMMFRRIFQNLIGNVIKYATAEMTVELTKTNKIIIITFENITYEKISNSALLLNRFYTADDSRANQSVGLGLSIVQSLVTTLGGRVKLQTDNNKFKIQLVFKHLYDIKKDETN
ncbi:sensor histidine kinase [Companilactobacillus kimchiensis]|uniref:histidine kinase n=1 Tax=Companilactobacillus kimchiensis TaxID=993692 RepID=A0A0R2LNC5_9LACO|nr:HAMP domain-containing sensor histidine kinase [Companilactobacillus kimchiensis]KRO00573.1 Signal transduction histidine kinase [Companilactobacillus kimchiensis]